MVHKIIEKPQPQNILQKVLSNQTGETLMVTTPAPIASSSETGTTNAVSSSTKVQTINQQTPHNLPAPSIQQQPQQSLTSAAPPTSSSMIKSLLANKVITSSTGTTEASHVAATNQLHHHQFDSGSASMLIKPNVNVHQVTPVCDFCF